MQWTGFCILMGVVLITESDWTLWNQILWRKFTVSDRKSSSTEHSGGSCWETEPFHVYIRDVSHQTLQDISLTHFEDKLVRYLEHPGNVLDRPNGRLMIKVRLLYLPVVLFPAPWDFSIAVNHHLSSYFASKKNHNWGCSLRIISSFQE